MSDRELPIRPCRKIIRSEINLADRCKALGLTLTTTTGGVYRIHDGTGRCIDCRGLWAAEHVVMGYEFAVVTEEEPRPGMWRDEV